MVFDATGAKPSNAEPGLAILANVRQRRVKTEELNTWINRLKLKKTLICRQRKADLRQRAMLSSALLRTETELKLKQQERYKKWQLIKSEIHSILNKVCLPLGASPHGPRSLEPFGVPAERFRISKFGVKFKIILQVVQFF
ncbi:hypothetical protein B566_EDAN009348 [Ephemera danica]|nr:hypothetical protein B566_EDAN009348 [Ephemera danica]